MLKLLILSFNTTISKKQLNKTYDYPTSDILFNFPNIKHRFIKNYAKPPDALFNNKNTHS